MFCLSTLASGQAATSTSQLSAKVLAAEPYYIKSASTVASMNADGTGSRVLTFAIAVQSDSALRELSVLTIIFSSRNERADFVYARVVHSDGTTQDTPVADAIEQPAPVTREAPLYSDLETKQLPVKSLRTGDTLEWQARFTQFQAQAPGQFWDQGNFSSGGVVLDETYELRVPAGFHLTVWTNPRAGGSFSESDSKATGQHIYLWRHADLKPTVGPEAEAAKKAEEKRLLTPDEELDATKGKFPDFAWTTFPDWASVGAWYRGLVADRATPDDAIKAKVAELIAGKSTDLDKAQAIYTFVSSHIRYVGVDFGIGRYQPHSASEVFSNQYGDCKDKHVLLASMLSVINIHADPVLVGAGIRFNSAVPAPESFNHVITSLSLDGKSVWLDSTAEIGTWGALFKTIRDQDALVMPAASPAVVRHTPADLPYPQTSTAAVDGTLDSSLTSESKITFTLRDDVELYLRAALRSISPANYSTFVQELMGGMGFGGTTSDPEISHLEDPSQPLQISFHYHRVKEKDWGENRITAIFQPIGLPAFTSDQPPTSTIDLGSLRNETSTLQIKLPDGWTAELPQAVHAHAPFANCDVTYTFFKDHILSGERRLAILQSKVPLKDVKQYESWYDDSGAGSYPYIQLSPAPKVSAEAILPEPKAPDAGSSTAMPSDPKAAELVQQAGEKARSFDLDGARKLLDQAAAINPTQAGLWSAYAGVAQLLGMKNQLLEDMHKELTYHPEEVQFYKPVAMVELGTSDPKASTATLRAWVKAAPDSVDAAVALVSQLQSLKFPDEALKEAKAAMLRVKASDADLVPLRILEAKAQVDVGYTSIAGMAVAPLLASLTDPVQINDVARILAESSSHLDEAATAEARIIAGAEIASASWNTSGDLKLILAQEIALASKWDTMALVLMRKGDFTQALGYDNAAIHVLYTKDAHDHLTTINQMIHNPAEAATLHADDQKLRTFPLGPANGRSGVASFTLLLADGKVLNSTPEQSDPSTPALHGAQQLLQAADLKALFPPGSQALLVRSGFVNCHTGVCELILAPLPAGPMAGPIPPKPVYLKKAP